MGELVKSLLQRVDEMRMDTSGRGVVADALGPTVEHVAVGENRLLWCIAGVVMGVITVSSIVGEVSATSVGGLITVVIVLGGATALFLWLVFQRAPRVVIDDKGFTFPREGDRYIKWSEITDLYISKQQHWYGEGHDLVIRFNASDGGRDVDRTSLDIASMSWRKAVERIEAVSGHSINVRGESSLHID